MAEWLIGYNIVVHIPDVEDWNQQIGYIITTTLYNMLVRTYVNICILFIDRKMH
jgi:hypothetical protein